MDNKSTINHWEIYWHQEGHQSLVCHKEMLENINQVINVRGKNILEVGAGMGGDGIFLAKLGANVSALDFSSKALAEINNNAKKENVIINTIKADAQNIPFPDEYFDLVFHQGFLEHFKDSIKIIKEQKRVLKKGGYLVIDVPQRYTTYTLKKHILMLFGKWFAGWEKEFSIVDLEMLIKKIGMEKTLTYGWGYYGKLYNIRNLPLGKIYKKLWDKIENSKLKLYLNWCIGIMAKKI